MIIDIVKQSLMITSFVLVMMLIIEFFNVQSKGNWSKYLQKNRWLQVIVASFFGIIPGCLGNYLIVSLYTHNIIGFGALVAAMISTFGDEAYVMIALMPDIAVQMIIILFFIGIFVGLIINLLTKRKNIDKDVIHFQIHETEIRENHYQLKKIVNNFRKISFHRAILFFSFSLFIFGIIIGELGHDHDHSIGIDKSVVVSPEVNNNHTSEIQSTEHQDHKSEWDWIRITFLIVSILALLIISIVSDHFLQEHIWDHIIKKHFLKIFLWTLFAMAVIALMQNYFKFDEWVSKNQIYILIFAVLIGIIPESGPHLIFVSMFFYGTIPFSILLANSVVQDGHGALPLFAESKKSFMYMKLINMFVALVVGFLGYFMGW